MQSDVTQAGEVGTAQRGGSEIEIGDRIGRYVVLARLGAGAMGIVYSAYDPQLDRRVALKLLNIRTSSRSNAGTRLLREARALARVDHPNVVTIYDVGLHAGQVFLAMQYIAGRTLGAWLREDRARDPRETLAVFEGAGRGLAAVHDAGMIHRDFKPENVMIGGDGVVRVMDFGLANLDALDGESTEPGDSPEPESEQRLTRTGTIVGTPAYMAPEQFRAQDVTSRSDQFGFCVALHEALYGYPPFPGDTYAELAAAVLEGRVAPARRGTKVPGWLRAVLLRGLSRSPNDRYASMPELLTALAHGGRRRRRALGLALVGGLALLLGTSLGFSRWQAAAKEAMCEREGDGIDEVWHAEQREAIDAAFEATGLEFASRASEQVAVELDTLAGEWRTAAREACRAKTIEQRWDADTHDKATWCLLDRRSELAALVEQLERADADVVYWVSQSFGELASPADCLDERLLAAAPTPPREATREAISLLRLRRAEARSLAFTGKHALALARVSELASEAEALDWPPLEAALALDESLIHYELERYAEAEQSARRAFGVAARIGDWDLATAAATQVAAGARAGARYEPALEWIELASITHVHAGDPRGLLEINRLEQLALIHLVRDEPALARVPAEAVLARREALFGPTHPAVADSLKWMAGVEYMEEDYAAARVHAERAVAIRETMLGPTHPMLFPQLVQLGKLLIFQREDDAAFALYARLLAFDRSPDESTAHMHSDIASFAFDLGDLHAAIDHYARSRLLFTNALGPTHPIVGIDTEDHGVALARLGRPRSAEAILRAAVQLTEPPGDPLNRYARFELGQLLLDEHGLAAASEARELIEPILPVEPVPDMLARVRLVLAELALAEQRLDDAAALLEQADAQLADADRPRFTLALGQLALARGEDARPHLDRLDRRLRGGTLELEPDELAKLELRFAWTLAALPDPTRDELALAAELSERGRHDVAGAGLALGAWRAALARR